MKLLFLLLAAPLFAGDLLLDWPDLAPWIVGKQVEMILPDATKIRGRAGSVRPDVLVMYVEKTSDAKLHPKGAAQIQRTQVAYLELRDEREVRRHGPGPIGGSIGIAGIAAGAAISQATGSSVPFFVVPIALALGAVVVEHKSGSRALITKIRIAPQKEEVQP